MSEFVSGLADASKKLELMGQRAGARALSSAIGRATTPVVRAMRAVAPKGTRAHKTYKGRLVAPGFASRQIARRSRFNKATGTASVTIGVRPEAFYLIQFYDQRPGRTPYTVSSRRVKGKGRKAIKPYTLRARPWFSSVFIQAQNQMLSSFRDILKANIEKAARGN
jgi:hypothetical protein